MSYHHFKGDPSKIYLVQGIRTLDMPATDKDITLIGYRGIGEAVLPTKLEPFIHSLSLLELLYAAIWESEYVEFEEIKEDGIIKNNNT